MHLLLFAIGCRQKAPHLIIHLLLYFFSRVVVLLPRRRLLALFCRHFRGPVTVVGALITWSTHHHHRLLLLLLLLLVSLLYEEFSCWVGKGVLEGLGWLGG